MALFHSQTRRHEKKNMQDSLKGFVMKKIAICFQKLSLFMLDNLKCFVMKKIGIFQRQQKFLSQFKK